jgi:hypothetical protein
LRAQHRTAPIQPPAGGSPLSEDDLKARVIDTAKLNGWRVHHGRPARTHAGWRTAVEGHAGLPDLVLARDGVVILAELKSQRGQPTDDQARWLAAAGVHARLWRPADWPDILAQLSAPRATV